MLILLFLLHEIIFELFQRSQSVNIDFQISNFVVFQFIANPTVGILSNLTISSAILEVLEKVKFLTQLIVDSKKGRLLVFFNLTITHFHYLT